MDKNTLSMVGQARALRALCGELAHGAAREGFVARVDAEIARLTSGRVGIAVVLLAGADDAAAAPLLRELAPAPLAHGCVLAILDPADPPADDDGDVVHAALAPAAFALGIDAALVLANPSRVFGSPLLLGRLLETCDVVLLVGAGAATGDAVVAGLRRLGESARCALRLDAPPDDPLAARLEGAFKEYRACARASGETSWLAALGRELGAEARATAIAEASAARLALCADLLNKQVQAEIALLKFRVADLARLRRGEDAQEPGGDPREQAEMLKRTLQEWTDACRADLATSAEQGVLPFDPRMLANRLTIHDLLHREEKAPAVIKYPILGAPFFHSLVTHHFTVLPDPRALEQVREHFVTALSTQAHKDVETLNQRAQELAARLKANVPLYPSFAAALGNLRVPVLAPGVVDRPVSAVVVETEAEDKFVRVGFFKRLMEGRMVASMAFSFLTMSAGVFVLFGEPNIKRGLMKFSGVIVIMMVLYFIFSMLVKGEEEKQELEEVLERVRARINQDILRPLAKVQTAILKAYDAFVGNVTETVLSAVETVARTKSAERTRLVERRKAEDDVTKAFLARRQAAAMASAQKVPAFVAALERLKAGPAVAPGALRPAAAPAAAASAAAATPRSAPSEASVTPMSASERIALARARAAGEGAATPASAAARSAAAVGTGASTPPAAPVATPAAPAAVKPMSASERIALARARAAGTAPAGPSAIPPGAANGAATAVAPAASITAASPAAPVVQSAPAAPVAPVVPVPVPAAASASPVPDPAGIPAAD